MIKRLVLLLVLCASVVLAGSSVVQRRFWPVYEVLGGAVNPLPGFSDTVAWYEFPRDALVIPDWSTSGVNRDLAYTLNSNTPDPYGSPHFGYDFDVSDTFNWGDIGEMDNWQDFTISFWAYQRPTVQANALHGTLAKNGNAAATRTWELYWSRTAHAYRLYLNGGNLVQVKGATSNSWHHVVYTRQGSIVNAYLDGAFSTNISYGTQLNNATEDFIMARRYTGSSGLPGMDGLLSQVAIWKGAGISQANVTTLYDAGRETDDAPLSISNDFLVCYWALNEDFDTYGDSSVLATNTAAPGAGAAKPTWVNATNTISAYISLDGGDFTVTTNESNFDTMFDGQHPFAVSLWYQNTTTNASVNMLWNKGAGNDLTLLYYDQNTEELICEIKAGDNVKKIRRDAACASFDDDVWHHLVLNYTGSAAASGLTFYRDNAVLASSIVTDGLSTNVVNSGGYGFTLGARGEQDAWFFVGSFDDVIPYSNNLTVAQIEDLFWLQAPNHGWSQFDADNKTQWSNSVYIGTFEYDSPADTSPQGNHGTKGAGAAAPTFAGGGDASNGWYNFDGGDYIDLGDNNDFSFGNGSADSPFSLSAWIRPESDPVAVLSKWDAVLGREYYFRYCDTNAAGVGRISLVLADQSGDFRVNVYSPQSYTAGNWMHVAATYDGVGGAGSADGVNLYVDGALTEAVRETNASYVAMENLTTPLRIFGCLGAGQGAGDSDYHKIHNVELTSNQVFQLYNDTKARYGL